MYIWFIFFIKRTTAMASLETDLPITSKTKDQLGRADFSASLAAQLHSWSGKDGLAVGITGNWGSGKTSILNMMVEAMEKLDGPKSLICRFEPWQWSGQEQLAQAFFKELERTLSRNAKKQRWRKSSDKEIADRFREYSAYLGFGLKVIQVPSRLITSLIAILVLTGVVSTVELTDLSKSLPGAVLICVVGVIVLDYLTGLAKTFTGVFEARSIRKNKTAEDFKNSLARILLKRESKIIVVVDDIDRLASSEIRLLFQLVKANLDLPNLVFVLLFQRESVELALQETAPGTPQHYGRRFLDKIIQVSYTVPRISRVKLENLLLNKLDTYLPESIVSTVDVLYWRQVSASGILAYIGNIRDVYRYLNGLGFHASLFENNGGFDANVVDVMALEALRIFEPTLYAVLPQSRELLTSPSAYGYEEAKRRLDVVLAESANRNAAEVILRSLFPVLSGNSGHVSANEARNSAFRGRRVCHPRMFDMYFTMSLAEVEMTRSDVEALVNTTADADAFYAAMISMKKQGVGGLLFEILNAHIRDIPVDNISSFIQALVQYVNEEDADHIFNAYGEAEDLIQRSLGMIDDVEKRGAIATAVLSNSVGLPTIEFFTTRELSRSKSGESVVNVDILEALQAEVLNRIRKSAYDGSLVREKALWQTLMDWSSWAELDEVRQWVDKVTREPANIVPFLRGIVHRSYTVVPVRKTNYYISRGLVERFIPMDTLRDRVDKAEVTSAEDEWVVGLFNDAFLGRGEGFE